MQAICFQIKLEVFRRLFLSSAFGIRHVEKSTKFGEEVNIFFKMSNVKHISGSVSCKYDFEPFTRHVATTHSESSRYTIEMKLMLVFFFPLLVASFEISSVIR